MEILRAFQIIKQDGMYMVNTISHTVDDEGNILKPNNRNSSYVLEDNVISCLGIVEDYLRDKLNAEK